MWGGEEGRRSNGVFQDKIEHNTVDGCWWRVCRSKYDSYQAYQLRDDTDTAGKGERRSVCEFRGDYCQRCNRTRKISCHLSSALPPTLSSQDPCTRPCFAGTPVLTTCTPSLVNQAMPSECVTPTSAVDVCTKTRNHLNFNSCTGVIQASSTGEQVSHVTHRRVPLRRPSQPYARSSVLRVLYPAPAKILSPAVLKQTEFAATTSSRWSYARYVALRLPVKASHMCSG